MAYWKLLIGPYPAAVDFSGNTDFTSWTLYQSIRHRGSQASGRVHISAKSLARPKVFHELRILWPDGTTLFGGIIQNVRQVLIVGDKVEYQIECSDYTRWLDHLPAGDAAYSGTLDVLVKTIIDDWVTNASSLSFGHAGPSAPITYTNVLPIAASYEGYNPNFQPVSQAIDFLCKTFYALWYVDVNRDLHVFLPDTAGAPTAPLPAPSSAVSWYDQDPINPTTVVSSTIPTLYADTDTTDYFDLVLSEEAASTISGVLIKDYSELSVVQTVDNLEADSSGNQKQFQLYNDPADPAHTSVVVTPPGTTYSLANGKLKTEYVDGQPTDTSPGDFCYVCPTNRGVRFGVAPAAGAAVNVTYNYYFPGRSPYQATALAAEIAAREGFGPGYYYDVFSGETAPITVAEGLPPWEALQQIMLKRYARIKIGASFRSYVRGWLPGQAFVIVSANRGDSAANAFTGWGTTFMQRFFVTQTESRIVNDTTVETSVEAVSDLWGY